MDMFAKILVTRVIALFARLSRHNRKIKWQFNRLARKITTNANNLLHSPKTETLPETEGEYLADELVELLMQGKIDELFARLGLEQPHSSNSREHLHNEALTLSKSQLDFMLKHHVEIETAYASEDLQVGHKSIMRLALSEDYQAAFADMIWDDAYDRYEVMSEYDPTLKTLLRLRIVIDRWERTAWVTDALEQLRKMYELASIFFVTRTELLSLIDHLIVDATTKNGDYRLTPSGKD